MLNRLSFLVASTLSLLCLAFSVKAVDAPAEKSLPTIVLVGDSIRMGYAPIVAKLLEGQANIVASDENGGDSSKVLSNLDQWVITHQPTVVHFNCGLHDIKISRKAKQPQISLDQYEKNLGQIVDRLQKETKARLIFATTTPIRDDLHAKREGDFDRLEADVKRYNEVALKVMKEKGVEIDDLHTVVNKAGIDKVQRTDGTHYTDEGSKVLAENVARSVISK